MANVKGYVQYFLYFFKKKKLFKNNGFNAFYFSEKDFFIFELFVIFFIFIQNF